MKQFSVIRYQISEFLRIAFAILIPVFGLLMTGCGFEPVYGVNRNTSVGVEEKLAQIEIGNIPDREGQFLKNELITRFYRNGRPINPRYSLSIDKIEERLTDLDITKDAEATRGQLRLSTVATLTDRSREEKLFQQKFVSIASYNILAGEFTNRVSEQNTRENALNDLARQIEQYTALALKRAQ